MYLENKIWNYLNNAIPQIFAPYGLISVWTVIIMFCGAQFVRQMNMPNILL